MKIKIVVLTLLLLSSYGKPAFCKSEYFETSAEEMQSYLCKLDGESGAGHIIFNFKPLDNISGLIEYSGLFIANNDKYNAIVHRVTLTKLQDFEDGSFTFEGTDETIGGGAVKGFFKSPNEFEVNGYFAKNVSAVECIYYRLTPLKSHWAKKVIKDNPKFRF